VVAEPPWTFATATPLTPVAFLHWSSERSWAEESNLMSAHCGDVSKRHEERVLRLGEANTYVVQRAATLAKLNDLNTRVKTVEARVTDTRVSSLLETFIEMGTTR
jgi:hypothetical protein